MMGIPRKQEMVGTNGHVISAKPLYLVDFQTEVLAANAEVDFVFPKRAIIRSIIITKESGTAVTFGYSLVDKSQANPAAVNALDVVLSGAAVASVASHQLDFAFVNRDDAQEEKAYLVINPNAGADNIYNIKIIAEMAI